MKWWYQPPCSREELGSGGETLRDKFGTAPFSIKETPFVSIKMDAILDGIGR